MKNRKIKQDKEMGWIKRKGCKWRAKIGSDRQTKQGKMRQETLEIKE